VTAAREPGARTAASAPKRKNKPKAASSPAEAGGTTPEPTPRALEAAAAEATASAEKGTGDPDSPAAAPPGKPAKADKPREEVPEPKASAEQGEGNTDKPTAAEKPVKAEKPRAAVAPGAFDPPSGGPVGSEKQSLGRRAMSGQGFNPEDMMRMLSSMKMPNMLDFQALAEAQRRNLEAMAAANRVAMEGAQAVARRNMELMQQTMSEMSEAMRGLTVMDGNPATKAAHQAELMKANYERAVTSMKELADLIQKSNGEALEVLNRRFAEALEEMQSMVKKG
jgi:phasin family protein